MRLRAVAVILGFSLAALAQAVSLDYTTVPVGVTPATVQFSGLAPGLIGVYQVNVLISVNAPTGSGVPVALSIGGVSAPSVTIAVGAS